jgi:hypothetical protein
MTNVYDVVSIAPIGDSRDASDRIWAAVGAQSSGSHMENIPLSASGTGDATHYGMLFSAIQDTYPRFLDYINLAMFIASGRLSPEQIVALGQEPDAVAIVGETEIFNNFDWSPFGFVSPEDARSAIAGVAHTVYMAAEGATSFNNAIESAGLVKIEMGMM